MVEAYRHTGIVSELDHGCSSAHIQLDLWMPASNYAVTICAFKFNLKYPQRSVRPEAHLSDLHNPLCGSHAGVIAVVRPEFTITGGDDVSDVLEQKSQQLALSTISARTGKTARTSDTNKHTNNQVHKHGCKHHSAAWDNRRQRRYPVAQAMSVSKCGSAGGTSLHERGVSNVLLWRLPHLPSGSMFTVRRTCSGRLKYSRTACCPLSFSCSWPNSLYFTYRALDPTSCVRNATQVGQVNHTQPTPSSLRWLVACVPDDGDSAPVASLSTRLSVLATDVRVVAVVRVCAVDGFVVVVWRDDDTPVRDCDTAVVVVV